MCPKDEVPTARICARSGRRHRLERLQSAQKRVQMVTRRERRSSIEGAAGIAAETAREDEPSGGEMDEEGLVSWLRDHWTVFALFPSSRQLGSPSSMPLTGFSRVL